MEEIACFTFFFWLTSFKNFVYKVFAKEGKKNAKSNSMLTQR